MEKGEKQDKKKGIEEGDPIWVESLMNREEWKLSTQKYPATCHIKEPPQFFKSDYEWRFGMGKSLNSEEIKNINYNISYLLTLNKS